MQCKCHLRDLWRNQKLKRERINWLLRVPINDSEELLLGFRKGTKHINTHLLFFSRRQKIRWRGKIKTQEKKNWPLIVHIGCWTWQFIQLCICLVYNPVSNPKAGCWWLSGHSHKRRENPRTMCRVQKRTLWNVMVPFLESCLGPSYSSSLLRKPIGYLGQEFLFLSLSFQTFSHPLFCRMTSASQDW